MNHFSAVVRPEPFTILDAATAVRFDMFRDGFPCPVILFDHVCMTSAGFPPHPHAGLSVITYLLENSPGSLRDRDSINREVIVRPGDVLWFQMSSGLIHEENPERDGVPVNQMQIWVPLARELQDLPPATFYLESAAMPVATDADGSRVKMVLGTYRGVSSPLAVTEPFTLLDVTVADEVTVATPDGWSGLVYLLDGDATLRSGDGESACLTAGEVVGVGPGVAVRISGAGAHFLFMARSILDQPLVIQGMYAMCGQDQIDRAKRRFHAGEFGDVVPYGKLVRPDEKYVPAGQEPDLDVTPVVLYQATVRHYDEGWWKFHLQYCRYEYNNTEIAYGYRFVQESPDGEIEPYRLGGYIPYMDYVSSLIDTAKKEGWGDLPYRDSF